MSRNFGAQLLFKKIECILKFKWVLLASPKYSSEVTSYSQLMMSVLFLLSKIWRFD